ncbi:MAG: bifunctional transcriptional activator/DNA repair enzyme AdaA [Chloroflexota bacterium]
MAGRDRSYDGVFFFGVKTTGVYCRPGCPSPVPRRDNVVFAFSAELLDGSGYRPCKRCRPDLSGPNGAEADKVVRVCRYIEQSTTVPSLEELSQYAGVSRSTLNRLFRNSLGLTPCEYADAHRMERFRQGLRSGAGVLDAAYDSGYGSTSRVYENTHGRLGMTPKTYSKRGGGVDIEYNIVKTPMGHLLVACTDSGVCSVKLGDDPHKLERELEYEFAAAKLYTGTEKVGTVITQLVDYLAGKLPWPELPYDVRATAFQRRVWDFLRGIPSGKKMHYGEVADALGAPKAGRAVGRACAVNPVALVVPCHRVVARDGSLTGYRWGIDRKRQLLAMERATCDDQQT